MRVIIQGEAHLKKVNRQKSAPAHDAYYKLRYYLNYLPGPDGLHMSQAVALQESALPQELSLDVVRGDGGTQSRVSVSPKIVSEYAQLMENGVTFPPITVWFDSEHYWLSDGFHRVEASKSIGRATIPAFVKQGTLDEARWDSLSANSAHGLRRSPRDIELIVTRALDHRRATGTSVNQLAAHLRIPEPTLRRWIKKVSSSNDEDKTLNGIDDDEARAPGVALLRDNHRLLIELRNIRQQTTRSETVALTNIMEKWFIGAASVPRVCEAIDRLFLGSR